MSSSPPKNAFCPRMTLTAEVGWKASQNTYWSLFLHGVSNGRHVICPRFRPIPQHPLSITLNPRKKTIRDVRAEPLSNSAKISANTTILGVKPQETRSNFLQKIRVDKKKLQTTVKPPKNFSIESRQIRHGWVQTNGLGYKP